MVATVTSEAKGLPSGFSVASEATGAMRSTRRAIRRGEKASDPATEPTPKGRATRDRVSLQTERYSLFSTTLGPIAKAWQGARNAKGTAGTTKNDLGAVPGARLGPPR